VAHVASRLKLDGETDGENNKGASSARGQGHRHGGVGRGGEAAPRHHQKAVTTLLRGTTSSAISAGIAAKWATGLTNATRRRRMSRHMPHRPTRKNRHYWRKHTSMSSNIKHASNATEVHLHEDKLFIQLGDWKDSEAECMRRILDSGATKHMTGSRSAFADLDEAIRGTVCFGDGSVVGIVGKGTVVVECKNS
jgi:hypothetical protein